VLYRFYSGRKREFHVNVTPTLGDIEFYITKDPTFPSYWSQEIEVKDSWHKGKRCRVRERDISENTWYNMAVIAVNDTTYTIVVDSDEEDI
jgi:hypothetical protein